ncbi:MAG: hypothetical protein WAN65_26435 [Candidatus Sulfotelmatobacter sp.]
MIDLILKIDEIHERFRTASSDISLFVSDVQRGFKFLARQHEQLTGKLNPQAEESSQALQRTPGEELVTIKVSRKELSLLQKVMHWKSDRMKAYPKLLLSMSFIYFVAAFDAFLADALGAVLLYRPEMLRSSKKQLSYEAIISFANREDLVGHMAARELNEVGYWPVKAQWTYYYERFGIDLTASPVSLEKVVEMVAGRNILVHNNGIVNEIYIAAVPATKLSRGDTFEISEALWLDFSDDLSKLALHCRNSLVEKFAKAPVKRR